MARTLQPQLFFSLRSPYSWLAWSDLRARHGAELARLELTPFWEPDAAYTEQLGADGQYFLYAPMSREKHLYILADVKRLAGQRGYTIKWPLDPVVCRWEVAHLAYFVAQAAGKGAQYIDAVCQARWVEGRNIHLPETIAEIGEGLGLDGAALAAAHLDPALREAGLAALRSCIANGVFGVPYFALGRQRFWGLDRLPAFLDTLAAAQQGQPTLTLAVPAAEAAAPPHQMVFDHAGGCG
ncbi:DsbA family protein [Janthinobacterium fluminis]|uniref:2-hydroxychromene-2-carboxylate isomerase n=1 Tax=Janthinobacterium fluminis TaxID=2987524 RepID=A0ABT5K3B7_9BURK|nr:DsbA family protein [Janthinobacterium fluminis]MDC8758950.1 DsbA family protein [Janthinobacterium fluminis]